MAKSLMRISVVSWCVACLTRSSLNFNLCGLQSAIKASGTKKEKKKSKDRKVEVLDFVDDEEAESKEPVAATADDLADEEWGPVKDKKGKKGKKDKKEVEEEPEADEDAGAHMRPRCLICV